MKKHRLVLKTRDYSQYHLSENPFPYTPIPSREPRIFVNQEKAISQLIDVVSITYTTGHSSHAVVIGPYGSGKSHTLRYIEKTIKESIQEGSDRKALSCYISSPGSGFLHIYREFIEKLGLDKLQEIVRDPSFGNLSYNVSRIFKALNNNELRLHAWRWILGDRLEARERSYLGVSRNLDYTLALSTLEHIIQLLRKEGHTLICLLIDELETVNELYPYQRQSMFNALRRMIDGNPEGLCTIFACTPAGWDQILESSIALSRRLSRNLVYISRLTREEAISLIEEYLRSCRIKQKRRIFQRKQNLHSNLHPFTPDAVKEIFQLSKGNIGELVKYCNLAIERGLDADLSQIDSLSLTELLAEFRG